MTRLGSTLETFAPLCREPDPAIGRRACAQVWRQTGLIVINPEHLGWADQTRAVQLAVSIYGPRSAR